MSGAARWLPIVIAKVNQTTGLFFRKGGAFRIWDVLHDQEQERGRVAASDAERAVNTDIQLNKGVSRCV